jgi:DNA-directed RNA polymerase specialized sigma24 family protein
MTAEGSVSGWIGLLRAGDAGAAQRLWERYFQGLVGVARQKLRDAPRRVADEEDVVLSAFTSFCQGVEQGRFPQLLDRDGLWRLLVVLTARKAAHLRRDQGRQKRGGAAHQREVSEEVALDQVLGREPSPEFAAQVAEECQRLLGLLDDDLRPVALWRMEGYTVEEVAGKLGYAPRSVKRKLQLIRGLWEQEGGP